MQRWFLVKKLDNAYRGLIIGVEGEPGCADYFALVNVQKIGNQMFNRNFGIYSNASLIEVLVDIKDSGRRFVKIVKRQDSVRHYELLGDEEKIMPKPKDKQPQPESQGFYVSPEARLTFNMALKMLKSQPQRAVKVLVYGPSGYGKTSLPRLVSQLTNMNFMRMNCATIRDPEEWFGYREAKEGSTIFITSEFAKRFTKGNLVMVLDEFNRLEPWLHNTLFPLLDEDGCTTVHDQEFRIGPGVLFVATINTGYKFTGTSELDEALVNRFDFVLEVGALPHNEEVKVLMARSKVGAPQAEEVVKVSTLLRQAGYVCSIRTTLLMVRMIDSGMTFREALDSAVIRRIPQDDNGSSLRKQAVDLINSKVGALVNRTLPFDIFSDSDSEDDRKDQAVAKVTLWSQGAELGFINLMSVIRGLPLLDGDVTMRMARAAAEDIRDGNRVMLLLNLTIDRAGVDALVQTLSTIGVNCVYEVLGDAR